MSAGERRARGLLVPSLMTLGALAILIALGTWQIERKGWKEALIATIAQRLAAPATDLPPRESWGRLDAGELEFRRVEFPAEFQTDQEALVYTSGSAFRADVSGPGYWVLTPARLSGGSLVVVNRGFVPEGKQDPKSRAEGQVAGVVDIVGVMRWPEPRGMFTPADDPGRNLWFLRDHLAIAAAKKWGTVAPFSIEQEAPPPPGGLPRVGKIQANLTNNHLQYAITWFGLAVVLVFIFSFWVRGRSR